MQREMLPVPDAHNWQSLWDFLHERQQAFYNRKVIKAAPPWSTDPVVQQNHFTNVYRELDPGTIYLVHHILRAMEPSSTVAFNVVFYRLFGHERTWDRLCADTQPASDGTPHLLRPEPGVGRRVAEVLAAMMAEGLQPFTPAYMVSNYGKSEPKPDVMGQVVGLAAADWVRHWNEIRNAKSRQGAHKALEGIYGVGRFVAFQALVDLSYPILTGGHQILNAGGSNNDWATCGPGAWSGINRIFPGLTRSLENLALSHLCHCQHDELERRGFKWLQDEKGERLPISRANMQNCMCEFHKYMRLREGEGAGRKRRFDPIEAVARDVTKPSQSIRYYGQAAIQTTIFS